MCAIVGSFNRDKLIELIELNSYRGSHSYSFSSISNFKLYIHVQSLGRINYDDIVLQPGHYGVVHVQAPTTEAKTATNIHPARGRYSDDTFALWHNGIIKANHVKKMQEQFGNDTSWDTELLLRAVRRSYDELSNVDGSFSCLYHDDSGTYLFRNDISPMFYGTDLSISSTKFEGSIETESNKILYMNFDSKLLYTKGEFSTVENPYFFFGDD